MKQKGYTVIELLSVLSMLGSLIVLGLAAWVIWHFVSKFW